MLPIKASRPSFLRFIVLRKASGGNSGVAPGPARVQLQKPAEQGHFQYSRNWSRDPRYTSTAPLKGDTPYTFLFRRLGHAYEVYPLFALTGVWFGLFCFAVYWSFMKVEVWLDRTHKTAPWDWERIRNDYYKMPTLAFDMDGRTHKRLEIMEKLQDEMLEAAKKRGTR